MATTTTKKRTAAPKKAAAKKAAGKKAAGKRKASHDDVAAVLAYLAAQPPPMRTLLERVRAAIRRRAPTATECLSYRIPTFFVNGRVLLHYAGFSDHASLFGFGPTVREQLAEAIAPFQTGKGTLQFTAQRPLPAALLERIVRIRLAETA